MDLEALLAKIDEAVKRDVQHIMLEVTTGKLSDKSARDLVQYRRLVSDTIAAQDEAAKKAPQLTEKELKALAKELSE